MKKLFIILLTLVCLEFSLFAYATVEDGRVVIRDSGTNQVLAIEGVPSSLIPPQKILRDYLAVSPSFSCILTIYVTSKASFLQEAGADLRQAMCPGDSLTVNDSVSPGRFFYWATLSGSEMIYFEDAECQQTYRLFHYQYVHRGGMAID